MKTAVWAAAAAARSGAVLGVGQLGRTSQSERLMVSFMISLVPPQILLTRAPAIGASDRVLVERSAVFLFVFTAFGLVAFVVFVVFVVFVLALVLILVLFVVIFAGH
jgi:hypothetical protein